MTRKLAYIVCIDEIRPIPKADAIVAARVGGWFVVVKKDEFKAGDKAVFIEIDAFLPTGNPAWQFLVDLQSVEYQNTKGHVLRTKTLRKQISQGFLIGMQYLPAQDFAIGDDVAEVLGITKYEAPIPKELEGLARGMYPTRIPKTDQERIQNLEMSLRDWQLEAALWEVTEKLEGASVTYAWLFNDFHACSRTVDYLDAPGNTMWAVAHRLDLVAKMNRVVGHRNLAFQGELVGPGIEGNIYKLSEHQFYTYDIYDTDAGAYLGAEERYYLCEQLGLSHVPVLNKAWKLDATATMEFILADAVGPSTFLHTQTREGKVFKKLNGSASFKAISNLYLGAKN